MGVTMDFQASPQRSYMLTKRSTWSLAILAASFQCQRQCGRTEMCGAMCALLGTIGPPTLLIFPILLLTVLPSGVMPLRNTVPLRRPRHRYARITMLRTTSIFSRTISSAHEVARAGECVRSVPSMARPAGGTVSVCTTLVATVMQDGEAWLVIK